MAKDSLKEFITNVKCVWGPLNTQIVEECRKFLEKLTKTRNSEKWLADLHMKSVVNEELYRDPEHGFMLLAHTEEKGFYRAPHDHGNGWVLYSVQRGEMEMGTYKQIRNQMGVTQLVRRERYRMHTGDCQVYLPGDIHDTRCISESILMFRLTSCDLSEEFKTSRMIRYQTQQ